MPAGFRGELYVARDFTREDSKQGPGSGKLRSLEKRNRRSVRASGPDAEWTIVGSSPLAKTYHSKQEFIDAMINPFNARMSTPLAPTIRGIFADGDMVIILFDAEATVRDGKPYRNTYTWYLHMKDAQVVKATAFFDNRISTNSGTAYRRSFKTWNGRTEVASDCGNAGICLCRQSKS